MRYFSLKKIEISANTKLIVWILRISTVLDISLFSMYFLAIEFKNNLFDILGYFVYVCTIQSITKQIQLWRF